MKKLTIFFGKILCALMVLTLMVAYAHTVVVYADIDSVTTETESENDKTLPELFIAAINPGYKIDGISNVGEMIEIGRRDLSDVPLSLAGITVGYTNSSGGHTVIVEFPENSWISGESILLRYASSPGHELASMTYTVKGSSAGVSQSAGPLELKRGEVVLDSVCWDGNDGCQRKFKSGSNESLVRNRETGEWEYVTNYEAKYVEDNYRVDMPTDEDKHDGIEESRCGNLRFSEMLSYYDVSRSEQFIELYNTGVEQVLLDSCKIKYKNHEYELSGLIKPDGYYVYYPESFGLTKNPSNYNRLELIDVNGAVVDTLDYPNGQRKGTAYMFVGYDAKGDEIWKITYAPTPGEPNNYQEFRTCEDGKVINEATGNCVKVTSISEKICGEGQYLNLLTGRCRKIEEDTTKTCKEGYYLNPETGRCRKIIENKGAEYEIKPETYEESSSFVALNIILVIVGIGVVYLVYEFRHEIRKLCGRVLRLFR